MVSAAVVPSSACAGASSQYGAVHGCASGSQVSVAATWRHQHPAKRTRYMHHAGKGIVELLFMALSTERTPNQ